MSTSYFKLLNICAIILIKGVQDEEIYRYKQHDITDTAWLKIKPYLPGRTGTVGKLEKDNRRFINGVLRVLQTGASWRALPEYYGNWNNGHRRFFRWRVRGIWKEAPNFEWLMIDDSHIKIYAHAEGTLGRNQDIKNTKGGSIPRYTWLWMRIIIRSDPLLRWVPQVIVVELKT